jgi:hypothetical protein
MFYPSAPPPADSTPVAGPLHLIRLHKHPSASRLPGSLWCRPSDWHPKTQTNRKSLMRSTPPSLLGIQAKVWWPANVNRRRLWCRWPCLIAAHRPKGFRFRREGRNRDLGLGTVQGRSGHGPFNITCQRAPEAAQRLIDRAAGVLRPLIPPSGLRPERSLQTSLSRTWSGFNVDFRKIYPST